jgi:hypothetical protein
MRRMRKSYERTQPLLPHSGTWAGGHYLSADGRARHLADGLSGAVYGDFKSGLPAGGRISDGSAAGWPRAQPMATMTFRRQLI